MRFVPNLFVCTALVAGCGVTTSMLVPDGGESIAFVDVPASTVPEPGVRRDVFAVPGAVAADNPITGATTPAALNVTQVLRYRQDADPPVPARAIVVAMPGLLEGGAGFEFLARALVKRGALAGAAIEVWAIDRRSNLLEDLRGMNTAEAKGDPEIAQQYYFENAPVGGQRFAGFVDGKKASYISEWGLATHVEDLRKVMALVPADARRGHVFLMGHSLGASFTEAFAAWRFADDGSDGVSSLAGLVFVDGILGDLPSTEEEYKNGSQSSFGPTPGIDKVRAGQTILALPLLGTEIYARVEIMSLRTLVHPHAVTADDGRDSAFQLLLSVPHVPSLTDAAALGFGFDDDSCPLAFARISAGHATGGALGMYMNAFGGDQIVHPTDPKATYDWVDALDAMPREWTPLANLAHSFSDGKTNFAEWYFPLRLPLDLAAVGHGAVPENGYQAAAGLRVFDGAKIDAPVLAISAGLVPATAFAALKARIAPAIGMNRPHAGATRDMDIAFKVLRAETMTHVDPLQASDRPENPVPAAVQDFVLSHIADGAILVPRQ